MQRPKSPKYTVEYQYQQFLHRVKLNEANMHPEQKEQLRMTFMAAFGQSLAFLRDDVSVYPERVAVEILEGMKKEVTAYFVNLNKSN